MQRCSTEKFTSRTVAKTLRRHRLETGDATPINNSITVSYRKEDLEMNKTGFWGNEQNKKLVSNMYIKGTIYRKLGCDSADPGGKRKV